MSSRLLTYLALADDICQVTGRLAEEATRRARATRVEFTLREEVLNGLVLKMDSSFRALVDDARIPRSEAMHHLKTLVESYMYFFVVGSDLTDAAADSVRMEGVRQRLSRLRSDPTPDDSQIATWAEILNEYRQDGILPIGERSLERLAKDHGVGDWYARVYRLACEPAHLGDLWEFMPNPADTFQVGPSRHSSSHAESALFWGLQIALAMLDELSSNNKLGLQIEVEPFRRRLMEA